MSETMIMPPPGEPETKRTPIVYFIDDSATMREVIKIAFRRESIQVITCADAASALAQFEQTPPDVVITDVIMPDQDGYSVCSQIKQHPHFGGTPVILMSGVVNKSVADKAVAVKADELMRKPFQPQELISRVKALLDPATIAAPVPVERPAALPSLSTLFAPPPAAPQQPVAVAAPPAEFAWPRALAEAFAPRTGTPSAPPAPQQALHVFPSNAGAPADVIAPAPPPRTPTSNAEVHRLRAEIARLELLIKKLQTELQIERQYNQALELHARTFANPE